MGGIQWVLYFHANLLFHIELFLKRGALVISAKCKITKEEERKTTSSGTLYGVLHPLHLIF